MNASDENKVVPEPQIALTRDDLALQVGSMLLDLMLARKENARLKELLVALPKA